MLRQFKGLWRRRDRRLTRRVQVQIPLVVYVDSPGEDPFHEDTRTASINVDGGLMPMKRPIQLGQRLLVTNLGNEQTQEAVVVAVRGRKRGRMDIVFRFPTPKPQFWSNLEIGKKNP
jgi:hypothetical protein